MFDEFREPGASSGENEFVAQLIDQYLVESSSRMAALKDAVERSDAPALRLVVHSLRGASSMVGAGRLAVLCGELEELARETTLDGIPALMTAIEDEFTRVRDALDVERGRAASHC